MKKREQIINDYVPVHVSTKNWAQKLSTGFILDELRDDSSPLSLFIDEMENSADLKRALENININDLADYLQNNFNITLRDIYSVSDIMENYNDLVDEGEIDPSYLLENMDAEEILDSMERDEIIDYLKTRFDIYDLVSIDWD